MPTAKKKPTRAKPAARRKPAPAATKPAPKPTGPRELTGHQVNEVNSKIRIDVRDDPGPGGGNHDYLVTIDGLRGKVELPLQFQKGPPAIEGVNGITNEALLTIVKDRLEGFQSGPFACAHNATALTAVTAALNTLNERTRDRVRRGVEGSYQK